MPSSARIWTKIQWATNISHNFLHFFRFHLIKCRFSFVWHSPSHTHTHAHKQQVWHKMPFGIANVKLMHSITLWWLSSYNTRESKQSQSEMSKEIKSKSEQQQRIAQNLYKKLKSKYKNVKSVSKTANSHIVSSNSRGISSSQDTLTR